MHEPHTTAWRVAAFFDRVGVAAGRHADRKPVDRRGEPGERAHDTLVDVADEAQADVDAFVRQTSACDANDLWVLVCCERLLLDQPGERR